MISKKEHYYVVINLGLRSIRVVLFDQNTQLIEKRWRPVHTTIENERVEQDPKEWWLLCSRLLGKVLSKKKYRENLHFITVTSSACCLVALDNDGEPIVNSYMVSDKRANIQADSLKSDPRFTNLFQHSNFLAVSGYMFPKIMWLKKHSPSKFKKVAFFTSSNDYLIYKLTGQLVSDPLNAEKFYYDSKEKKYPEQLLLDLHLNTAQFPDVKPIGYIIGPLKKELQEKYNLNNNVNILLTTYDAICAFIGSGTLSEGEVCNVCGTVSSIRALTKKKVTPGDGILAQKLDTFSIVGGSNNIDGGLLEWSNQVFYGNTYANRIYKQMENEARKSPSGARGLLFIPYLLGERLPFFDSSARGIFFGLERFHRRGDLIRSIFESSGFMVLDILQAIEKRGVNIKSIRMSGGMTRNHFICQIRADITGRKVYLVDEMETTSLGAYFIMLKHTGVIKKYSQLTKNVKILKEFRPNKRDHKLYVKLFLLFKEIYSTNRELMQERNKLLTKLRGKKSHTLKNL